MEEYEKIELRSEEIQEILGTPPRWIVRWGTTVAFFTFCILLFTSYFVRYPDIIKGPIVLVSANPAIELTSQVDAAILLLQVKNGQPVKQGDILGQLDALANYNDVLFLEQQLKMELSTVDQNSVLSFVPAQELQLGIIQPFYTLFIKNYESYRFGVSSNFVQQNIQSLNYQITSLQNAIRLNNERIPALEKELLTAKEAVLIVQKRYGAHDTSVIGDLQSATFLVNKIETELKNLEAENATKLAEISNLQTQIKASQAQSGTSNINNLVALKSDISNLLSEIEKWKKDYFLIAPKGGTVVIAENIREKQAVRKNEKILSIVPEGDQPFYGKVMLPIKGSGKVEREQEVVIKFDNFPYHEYGMVKGVVERKDILPNDNVQHIFVSIDQKLITNQDKTLTYSPFMQGTAEIITKDRRFIERVFENVTAFLEDH